VSLPSAVVWSGIATAVGMHGRQPGHVLIHVTSAQCCSSAGVAVQIELTAQQRLQSITLTWHLLPLAGTAGEISSTGTCSTDG